MNKFFSWLGALIMTFGTNVKKFIEEYATPAIAFLNSVKSAINNPEVDVIVNALSGGTAQAVIDELSAGLVDVIKLLQTDANEITGTVTLTPANAGNIFSTYLAKQPVTVQNALIIKSASLLANKLALKNNITLLGRDADTYTQLAYDKISKEAVSGANS